MAVHQLPSYTLEYRISMAKKRYGAEYKVHEGMPDVIAVSRYNDTPHLSYVHEVGHFVDRRGLTKATMNSLASYVSPDLEKWRFSIAQSAAYQDFKRLKLVGGISGQTALRYLMSPQELWARSYAQYIAIKTQHPGILAELGKYQQEIAVGLRMPVQWQDDDFLPIIKEIDMIFRGEGWL